MLAASQTDGFSVPLLVAAAAVALAWWLVLGTVAALRRPPRIAGKGGAALEAPPEPPAVAGILAGDFEVAKETAPAVLLDLAARGFVSLDEVQPGRTVCRLRQGGDDRITDYEDRVLTELRTKAVDGVVPADALTTGPELQSKGWHRALAKEVIVDAQSRGLTSPRWPLRLNAVLGLALGAIVVLLFVAAQVGGDADDDGTLLGAIAAAVAIGGLIGGGVVGGSPRRVAGPAPDTGGPGGCRAMRRPRDDAARERSPR